MRAAKFLVAAVLWLGLLLPAQAQPDYRIWCLYMHKFSQHVKWPESKPGNEMIIGVYGISPIIPALESYFKQRNSASMTYKIKKVTTPEEARSCNMLFITKEQQAAFPTLVKDLKGKNVLIMAEIPGIAKRGACINFLQETDIMVKVEINKHCIEGQGLKISTQGMSYGTEVK